MPCVAGGCSESNVAGSACTVLGEETYKLIVVHTHARTSSQEPPLLHYGESSLLQEGVRRLSENTPSVTSLDRVSQK